MKFEIVAGDGVTQLTIDGQLDAYDEHYWLIRFTPRKPRSKWSQLNRRRATELLAEGRMRPGGLAQMEMAKSDDRWERAYAPASAAEPPPPHRREAAGRLLGIDCEASVDSAWRI
jgi:hypothetical protein